MSDPNKYCEVWKMAKTFPSPSGPYEVVKDRYGEIELGLYCRASLRQHLDPDELFELTRRGLDFFQAPGRMNFYNEHPFRVILDYAHNAHGMRAVTRTIRELNVNGRRIGVIAAPGDRRDEDILALAAAAVPAFDLVMIREDDDLMQMRTGVGP